jgi:hypothetical protein
MYELPWPRLVLVVRDQYAKTFTTLRSLQPFNFFPGCATLLLQKLLSSGEGGHGIPSSNLQLVRSLPGKAV